ncbi:MAG: sulfotransferase [Pseudomonadota bacterium]
MFPGIRERLNSAIRWPSDKPLSQPQFFLGVGVPKAGTSWLHAQLKRHPEVWVPPLKELHFWDLPRLPNAEFYRLTRNVRLKNAIERGASEEVIGWHRRHALGHETIEWYRSLFSPEAGHRAYGEITPNYASLPYEDLVKIRNTFPDAKVFCVLRDPVDRVVSNIRFKIGRGKHQLRTALRDPGHFAEAAQLDGGLELSRYEVLLPKLDSVFGENLLVIFYEDLFSEDGQTVLDSLHTFLGVTPVQANLSKKANASEPVDMPFDPYTVIGDELLPAYAATRAFMGKLPKAWATHA